MKTEHYLLIIFRLEKLSAKGAPLERLNSIIDWEMFRPTLSKIYDKERKSNAGVKPYDPVLMFKILILRRYCNLSDKQAEYQILDRLSFCRFLGLQQSSRIPDQNTIWNFREEITEQELEKKLFEVFENKLDEEGIFTTEGRVVDASFIEMPKQRNTKAENDYIKETGTAPEGWEKIQTNYVTKILMHNGQRKTMRHTMDIKIMFQSVQKRN